MSVNIEARLVDALEARIVPRRSDVLRVCLVVPQSGALGMVGPSALDAALLATHEINVADGVGGRYVDLVLVDGGRAPVDVAEVRALCDAGAVDVVTGIHTSDVHRAVESVVAGRTPYVFTPPHEGGPRRTGVVCTGAHPASQLSGPLAWLTATYSLRRWALVGNDYIWPQAVHRVAHRLVRRGGAEVVMDERIPLGRVTPRTRAGSSRVCAARAPTRYCSAWSAGTSPTSPRSATQRPGPTLVRLSGSLEENGLYAVGGDESGTMFAAMQSFASLGDENRLGLDERHRALFGETAPVLDAYAEGVYDGVHLVASLAAEGLLRPDLAPSDVLRLTRGAGRGRTTHLARGRHGLHRRVHGLISFHSEIFRSSLSRADPGP